MSAAELMAELDRDPDFVAGQVDDLVREEANRRRYREAAAPVLAELADAGFAVDTVGQLRRSGIRYTAAVPILARWMSRVDYRELHEDLVRSLAVPWAREAAPALLAEFRAGDPSQDPPDTSPRWVVGLALSAIANPSLADDLIELAADRRWGGARGMLLVRERHIRIITEDGELLRELTLDPARDYQPQARS